MMKLFKEVVIFEHCRLYLFGQIIQTQLQKECPNNIFNFCCKHCMTGTPCKAKKYITFS